EVYEVIESIDERNWESLEEELGDVLLHIAIQARIAEEASKFSLISIIRKLNQKIISRHPNVFNKKKKIDFNWEEQKHAKGERESRLDGVPKKLSALIRAHRLQQKASDAGFDWTNVEPVINKVYEEIKELEAAIKSGSQKNIEEEFGDILFSMVNLSRHLELSSENALRKSNNKFTLRFKKLESETIKKGKKLEDLTLQEMDNIWNKLKA
ncbi:MAG: nucleoside triphosphate pyrophosphohydrolase, partial [Flavobacteriaceae bacterium]|nr:nucleoside triphosphate pyrophosphohydrolase [Flavobacteriaceae bacterium]